MLGDNGWITRRLIYVKDIQKNIEKHARGVNKDTSPARNAIDETQAEFDLDSLKKMMTRNFNISEAVEKLNSTRKYRKLLMAKKETDVRQKFPFFLVNPQLVSLSLKLLMHIFW